MAFDAYIMARKRGIWDIGDICDKCKKPSTEERRIIRFCEHTRNEHHVIILHMDCLLKIYRKAEKELSVLESK